VNNQADVSQIILTRRLTSGQTVERRIDLWKTIQEGKIEEDIFLKDGDAIFVPRRTADSPVDIRVLARTTLAPGRIRVRVFGEVNRASSFDLDARSTVVDAIASAGGMRWSA
jgi:polysaccharide biosynthesis/export protein